MPCQHRLTHIAFDECGRPFEHCMQCQATRYLGEILQPADCTVCPECGLATDPQTPLPAAEVA